MTHIAAKVALAFAAALFVVAAFFLFSPARSAQAQVPTPTPTPETSEYRFEEPLTFEYHSPVYSYVFRSTGETIFFWRYQTSQPAPSNALPSAHEVLEWRISPPAWESSADGWDTSDVPDIVVRPVVIPGSTTRGYGNGFALGRCSCYARYARSGGADDTVELARHWRFTSAVDPARVSGRIVTVSSEFSLTAFVSTEDDDRNISRIIAAHLSETGSAVGIPLVDDERLTEAGEVYIDGYYTSFQTLLPQLYLLAPRRAPPEASREFNPVSIAEQMGEDGGPLDMGMDGISELINVDRSTTPTLVVFALAIGVAILVHLKTGMATASFGAFALACMAGAVVGWFQLGYLLLVVMAMAMVGAWVLFGRRA